MLNLVEALGPDWKLKLIGSFRSEELLNNSMRHKGWAKTKYLGQLSREDVLIHTSNATAGLLLFHDVPNHKGASPNKLYEYLARGMPVICSDCGHWKDLIQSEELGIVTTLTDEAIIKCANQLENETIFNPETSKKCIEFIKSNASWDSEFEKFYSYMVSINK